MKKNLFSKLLMLFFACQVVIDLAQSVTAFPFLHYGMYSESFSKPDSIRAYEIIVNEKVISPSDYSAHTWGSLFAPLSAFESQVSSNDFSFDKEKMKEGLAALHFINIYKRIEPNLNNDPSINLKFPAWYKKRLENILEHPIQKLQVNIKYYIYKNGNYFFLKKQEMINI